MKECSVFFSMQDSENVLKKVGDGTALLMLLYVKEMEARHLLMLLLKEAFKP